jgi:hypothetical protein
MASFPANSVTVSVSTDVLSRLKYSGRGGLTATTLTFAGDTDAGKKRVILFGGADRAGEHYNDVVIVNPSTGTADRMSASGRFFPSPLGGHAAVMHVKDGASACFGTVESSSNAVEASRRAAIGAHARMLVFGGIDFVEERVFDEVYELRIAPASSDSIASPSVGGISAEWHRTKVEGEAPLARTGHSLIEIPISSHMEPSTTSFIEPLVGGAVTDPVVSVAVVFGGSSPVEGPMNDLYALQSMQSEDPASYKYRWQPLGTTGDAPQPRELYAAFFRPGSSGELLSPALTSEFSKPTPSPAADADCPSLVIIGGRNSEGKALKTMHVLNLSTMKWSKSYKIPHAVASAATAASSDGRKLYVYGGWAGATELSSAVHILDTTRGSDPSTWIWTTPTLSPSPLPPPRFACAGVLSETAAGPAMLVFGGMEAERDADDMLILRAPGLIA